jgi:hypothetical protein
MAVILLKKLCGVEMSAGRRFPFREPPAAPPAVGGFLKDLPVFHLDDWLAPSPLGPDDLCLWGEIISGQRIEDGGGVTNLTADEWPQRWRDFRRRRPGYGTFGAPVKGQERRSP